MFNNYWLSTLCPRQFNTARKLLVGRLHWRGHCNLHTSDLNVTPYRCRQQERPGSSVQTSFVAATNQRVRFAWSLATRFHAGGPRLLTCVCPLKWVGGKRAFTFGRWHAGHSLTLHVLCLSFSPVSACSLHVLFLLYKPEPIARNIGTYLQVAFVFWTCSSGNFCRDLGWHF